MSELSRLIDALNSLGNHPNIQDITISVDGKLVLFLNNYTKDSSIISDKTLSKKLYQLKFLLDDIAFSHRGYPGIVFFKFRALKHQAFYKQEMNKKLATVTFQCPQTNIFITYEKHYQTNYPRDLLGV